jgi:hypothetical protein
MGTKQIVLTLPEDQIRVTSTVLDAQPKVCIDYSFYIRQ